MGWDQHGIATATTLLANTAEQTLKHTQLLKVCVCVCTVTLTCYGVHSLSSVVGAL